MKIIYDTETNEFGRMTFQPIATPRISITADFTIAIDKNLWLHLSGEKKFLAQQVEAVNMVSSGANVQATDDITVLRPTWIAGASGLATGLKFDLKFRPEADQRMWLVLALHNDAASFVASDNSVENASDIYMPGFNNIFPDGRICTGHARVPSATRISQIGMSAWVNEWISVWSTSPFNGDLRREYHQQTLRFDPDTLENVLLGEDWRSTYVGVDETESATDVVQVLKAITNLRSAA